MSHATFLRSLAWLPALLLAACGGGGGADGTPADPPPASAATVATAQAGDVVRYVVGRLEQRDPHGMTVDLAADGPGWIFTATTATGVSLAPASGTGTTVQEAGVDEDDLIKTDGQRIFTLQPLPANGNTETRFARLAVHGRVASGRPPLLHERDLHLTAPGWAATRGLQLDPLSQRVAVLAESSTGLPGWGDCPPGFACIGDLLPYRPQVARSHVQIVDLGRVAGQTRPEQPALRLDIDGRLVGSRLVGSMLYVVLSHAPALAYDRLLPTASAAERRVVLDAMKPSDLLPSVRVDGGPAQPLVAETDCWLQRDNGSRQVVVSTITAIDLASPGYARTSRCFVGGSEALYVAPAAVYLATQRDRAETVNGRLVYSAQARTDIHKFALAGARVDYRGSGTVEGHLGWDAQRAPYRMSEHAGDLRVLSFTGPVGWFTEADAAQVAASPATLTVLRERPAEARLQVLATLPSARRPAAIGKPGEQVYGVRFAGERAYVVTFRRTDPLYVLDLADPADPRVAGELLVPGFSDWLYPLDGGLLFGVGHDADAQGRPGGVKLALFDVRDAAQPRLLDSRTLGLGGSASSLDFGPHGISFERLGGRVHAALQLQLMLDGRNQPQQTLQRVRIDTGARTMALEPALELGTGWVDLGAARTLQLDSTLYHLQDGRLQAWAW
jgi:hypothetical protein